MVTSLLCHFGERLRWALCWRQIREALARLKPGVTKSCRTESFREIVRWQSDSWCLNKSRIKAAVQYLTLCHSNCTRAAWPDDEAESVTQWFLMYAWVQNYDQLRKAVGFLWMDVEWKYVSPEKLHLKLVGQVWTGCAQCTRPTEGPTHLQAVLMHKL